IVDDAGDDLALAFEADRNREMRNAVQKIQGAVERIDNPGVGLVGTLMPAGFLAEETIAGPRLRQLVAQDLLGTVVGGRNEIPRPFERHLQMLDLAEVALEPARRLLRSLEHHVEQRGTEHWTDSPRRRSTSAVLHVVPSTARRGWPGRARP